MVNSVLPISGVFYLPPLRVYKIVAHLLHPLGTLLCISHGQEMPLGQDTPVATPDSLPIILTSTLPLKAKCRSWLLSFLPIPGSSASGQHLPLSLLAHQGQTAHTELRFLSRQIHSVLAE